ncbi:MAG: hypothetical protein PVJ80_02525 [Gemmatimonadota bacterium]|jgi:hypothetical protein
MNSLAKILIGAAVAASSLAVLIFGVGRFREAQRFSDEIERLRGDLYQARASSDRCRSSLTTGEALLQDLTTTIDSLRARVDSFEALGNGQVPADDYDEYLGVFDTYNDSVASWEIRSERLREAETACRESIEDHNALRDSIQTIIDGMESRR